MKKIIRKNLGLKIALASLVIGFVGVIAFGYQTYAANITAGVLNISFVGDRLFSETNLAPGSEVVKDLTVTNTGTLPHSFSIAANGVSGDLADVLQIEPRDGGVPIWSMTLAELSALPDESKMILSSVGSGETKTIQIAAILPSGVGNAYQGKSTSSFSFVMGNESTDQAEPLAFSAPTDFALGVSGEAIGEEDEGVLELEGDVKGEEDGEALGVETESMPVCFWWWILLAVFAVSLIILGYRNKDKKQIIVWSWPIIIGLALYLIHWILHDYYTPSNMCPYFIWFELLGLVLYGGGVYIKRSQVDKK